MRKPILGDLIVATGELATLPETIVQLLDVLHDPMVSADTIHGIIERDPAMTANVLKQGNSAYYGAMGQIKTVREALVRLGNRNVATLAFTAGMVPVLRRDLVGYALSRHAYWDHALLCGAAASLVVSRLGSTYNRCEAFTAGLVHDLGMMIIDPWLKSNKITVAAEGPVTSYCPQEQEILGFDHCRAGLHLATSWGFPDSLAHVMGYHHDPLSAPGDISLVQAVAVGDVMAKLIRNTVSGAEIAEAYRYLELLGFPKAQVEELSLDLTGDLEQTLATAMSPVPT